MKLPIRVPPGFKPAPEAEAFKEEMIAVVNKYIATLDPSKHEDGKLYMQVLGIFFAEAVAGLKASGVPMSDAMQLLGAAYGGDVVHVHEVKIPMPSKGDA